jgi:hypothetical protein
MDVSVLSKHRQRSLRSAAKASVLGDGLLERTRSTMLALLGATAAIGLAMIALALNQGWPLIAGAPIPDFGSGHQAVGKAAVVAKAKARGSRQAISAATRQTSPGASSGKPRPHSGVTVALSGSQAPQAAGLVASHPTPASPAGEAIPDPTPVAQQPAPAVAPAPTPAPAAVPVSSSNPSPPSTASETPESPIPSQAPPANNEGDEHGHGHTSHGHGHSHGGDPDTPEPTESPGTAPDPSEAPAQEADAPEESESEQSHSSSWGHGGGHGHGRW